MSVSHWYIMRVRSACAGVLPQVVPHSPPTCHFLLPNEFAHGARAFGEPVLVHHTRRFEALVADHPLVAADGHETPARIDDDPIDAARAARQRRIDQWR